MSINSRRGIINIILTGGKVIGIKTMTGYLLPESNKHYFLNILRRGKMVMKCQELYRLNLDYFIHCLLEI